MSKSTPHKDSKNICFQCGSSLIFVSEEVVKPEGTRFAQTNTIYRCSNDACQERKDKEKADRIKQQEKKAEMTKIRLEEQQEKRKLNQKAKAKKN